MSTATNRQPSTVERLDRWTVEHPHAPAVRQFLRFPVLLWRCGLGRALTRPEQDGARLAMLTVTGRTSRAARHTAVSVHEVSGCEYLWCPYGTRAQWYRNVLADPLVTLQTHAGTHARIAVRLEDYDEARPVIAHLRRLDLEFWRSYLASLAIEDTDDDLQRNWQRLHLLRLVVTGERGPAPLRADLVWIWAVPVLALLRARRNRCTRRADAADS